jgi:hypothetical protein
MEKVIEVNQSKTVYNLPLPTSTNIFTSVTMTMQRIEITPEGVWIYFLATSPDSLRGFPGISFGGTPAQYSVDDMVKTKKNTGGGLLEDNVRLLIWEYIEPFPVDAKELIFKITRFGEWEGPWEFHVPLE